MLPRRLLALTLLALALLTLLGGCGPQALPARATRTPMPTFTPTMAAIAAATRPPETPAAPEERRQLYLPAVEQENEVGSAVAGGRLITVDQQTQLMHVYEDGVVVKTIPCSTGLPDQYRTPSWDGIVGEYWGTFVADGLYADDAWFLFKDRGSILIHSLPYTYEAGARVYEGLGALGQYPSSHGCIRIHPNDARWLKTWNPAGVPITITAWAPKN